MGLRAYRYTRERREGLRSAWDGRCAGARGIVPAAVRCSVRKVKSAQSAQRFILELAIGSRTGWRRPRVRDDRFLSVLFEQALGGANIDAHSAALLQPPWRRRTKTTTRARTRISGGHSAGSFATFTRRCMVRRPPLDPRALTRSPPASHLLKGHHHPTDLVARFSPQNPRMNSSTSPATTS